MKLAMSGVDTSAFMPKLNAAALTLAGMPKFNAAALVDAIVGRQSFFASESIVAQFEHLLNEARYAESGEPGISVDAERGAGRTLSSREVAVYFTVLAFLIVYFSLGIAIKHDAELAAFIRDDGPTPFEAAMAAGALTFWAVRSWLSS